MMKVDDTVCDDVVVKKRASEGFRVVCDSMVAIWYQRTHPFKHDHEKNHDEMTARVKKLLLGPCQVIILQ